MTTPTPADAVRAAIDALRNATNAEIAAAAIRAAADALLPRPAIGDQSKGAVQARLLRLQFLGLANEVKGTPLPAASREALAEAREESQSAAWGDIEPDQVLPAVEALARSVAPTAADITPGPYSEQELRDRWNAQADEFNAWDSLDTYERLAWAQTQAIAADRAALAEPAGEGEERWYPNFADWLEREMPEGTVIGDPLWWASKIATYLAKWGRPAALADKPEVEEEQREAVRAAVTEALGDVYDWMGEHDFTLVAGDPGRVAEIADAAIEAMRPAAPPALVAVTERLPEPSVKVLAHYFNGLGNGRTVCAIWVPAKSRSNDISDDDNDFTEYDEEAGKHYWPEGWYETIEHSDELGYIKVYEGEVVYWQPLPQWPAHVIPLPQAEEEE